MAPCLMDISFPPHPGPLPWAEGRGEGKGGVPRFTVCPLETSRRKIRALPSCVLALAARLWSSASCLWSFALCLWSFASYLFLFLTWVISFLTREISILTPPSSISHV